MDGLAYMEQTGTAVGTRTTQALMAILDARYGKTDSGRSWSWLNQFTEFVRAPGGNPKYSRARYLRTTTRLGNLGMSTSAEMMFPNATQALKLSEFQLPISLSALGAKENGQTIAELKEIAIKMFETHRHRPDPSDVFREDEPVSAEQEEGDGCEPEEDDPEEPDIERADGNGEVSLLRPKRAHRDGNAPGDSVAASKGAIDQSVPKHS